MQSKQTNKAHIQFCLINAKRYGNGVTSKS